MKEPENWSLHTADTMIFNAFVFCGFNLFEHDEEEWVVDSFCNFVDNIEDVNEFLEKMNDEYERKTTIARIMYYVPSSFLHLLFLNFKRQKRENKEFKPEELVGAWELYLHFLNFAYKLEIEAHKQKEESPVTPEHVIKRCKELLNEMHKVHNMYDNEKIEYFCYLSRKHVTTLRGSLEN